MLRTAAALLAFSLASTPAWAATYEVDPTHSTVAFAITHMMMSTVHGSFPTVSGTIEYDAANVAATKATATVGVASVDTRNADRDTHLKSPDFFDVAKFPEMTFASKSVTATATGFDMTGDLTIHGVTKSVTFHVNKLSPEMKDPWGNTKVGTSATTVIKRQDFGLVWNKNLDQGGYLVGDDVTITLDLELKKK